MSAGAPTVAKSQNLEPIKAWQYSMKGHAQQCVERYVELSGKAEQSLKPVSTPCIDDHNVMFMPQECIDKGQLSPVACKIVLKMFISS